MYRPYERDLARQQIPLSERGNLTAAFIEAAYVDDAQKERITSEDACGIDPARLELYRVSARTITGVEQELLRGAHYPEV
jgi:hypothetical protein